MYFHYRVFRYKCQKTEEMIVFWAGECAENEIQKEAEWVWLGLYISTAKTNQYLGQMNQIRPIEIPKDYWTLPNFVFPLFFNPSDIPQKHNTIHNLEIWHDNTPSKCFYGTSNHRLLISNITTVHITMAQWHSIQFPLALKSLCISQLTHNHIEHTFKPPSFQVTVKWKMSLKLGKGDWFLS